MNFIHWVAFKIYLHLPTHRLHKAAAVDTGFHYWFLYCPPPGKVKFIVEIVICQLILIYSLTYLIFLYESYKGGPFDLDRLTRPIV